MKLSEGGLGLIRKASYYKPTGNSVGRPQKLKPRPNKNLWFDDDRLWLNDLNLSRQGDFDLISTEDEETVIAVDKNHNNAYGWWNKTDNKGITFKSSRPLHTVLTPKQRFKQFMALSQ